MKATLAKKAMFLLSLLVILSFTVSPVSALRNAAVKESNLLLPDVNDDFGSALVVAGYPYHRTTLNFEATEALDDPTATRCNLAPGLATVWYSYTPAATVMVHLDTIDSSYDTYLAIWTGVRGSLVEVACNDDASPITFASAINITLTGGITYYIQVAQFNGNIADVADGSIKPDAEAGDVRAAGATHAFRLVRLFTRAFKSYPNHDGYVVEFSETSNKGLLKDSALAYIRMGDDEKKRQYVGILSFNTAILPDTSVVAFAMLKVKQSAMTGGNVFTKLGKINVDVRAPFFGAGLQLEGTDFESAAVRPLIGIFGTTAVSGWYSANLNYTSFAAVNLTGYTQYRLKFKKDDNNDTVANYIRIHSGNSIEANKPILILRYYIP